MSILSFIKRKIFRVNRERWNYQYAEGRWEGLKSAVEHERFLTTIRLFEAYKKGGSILEIGCGEALLQQKMLEDSYLSFEGIDLSDVAIERANALQLPRGRYHATNMETFVPQGQYDAVIFTESLNYAKNPTELLLKYTPFLNEEGVFIVSMFRNKYIPEIWKNIETVFRVLNHQTTQNERGIWDCKVLKK